MNSLQILSLCLPVLLNSYEKFNPNQTQAGGKKKRQTGGQTANHIDSISSKEKHSLIVDALKDLRETLIICESSLGEYI